MKKSFYQFANSKGLTSEDATFVHLAVVLHYPLATAFTIAYQNSNANMNSAAAMASRKIRDKHIQLYVRDVLIHYNNQALVCKDLIY